MPDPLLPDGNLFRAVREGRASVAADTIERFTETGIRLACGQVLPADIVVSATGLQPNVLGEVRLSLGGTPVELSQAMVCRGMMFSGVPNLVSTFGYTNASWTLKADLASHHAAACSHTWSGGDCRAGRALAAGMSAVGR